MARQHLSLKQLYDRILQYAAHTLSFSIILSLRFLKEQLWWEKIRGAKYTSNTNKDGDSNLYLLCI